MVAIQGEGAPSQRKGLTTQGQSSDISRQGRTVTMKVRTAMSVKCPVEYVCFKSKGL